MFRSSIRTALAIGLVATCGRAAETLAVPDFENVSQRNDLQFLARTLSDALSQPLVERHKFVLVERQRLSELLKEKGLALTGALGDSAASKPLQVLEAEELLLGSFDGTSSALRVQLRLLKVSDGRMLGTLDYQGTLEQVLTDMGSAADQIEGILHGKAFGFLELQSDPTGLEVVVDGAKAGRTPLHQSRLLAGKHQLNIVSHGKILWHDSLAITSGKTEFRHVSVDDPAVRQGVSMAVGTGILWPMTSERSFGNALDLVGWLQMRRGSFALGVRGFFSDELKQEETFPIPYGSRTEDRTLQLASLTAIGLWYPPVLGPLEFGLGLEFGNLWSWDSHPKWRTDLASTRTDLNSLVAGPLLDITWISGHRLDLFLSGQCPVTLQGWKRDRVVRQDLFPIGKSTNLVVAQEENRLMLPTLQLGLRVHL
jgi:TolB-like protein